MSYILPDKSLLEEKSSDLEDNTNYYSLSKLTYKKDLNKKLLFPIGLNSEDKYFIDLEKKSSILILGETGSGKTVLLNSIIISMLLKNTPDELKFLFIDPRGVELSPYNNIPHMIKPTINNKEEALFELENIKKELENRQDLLLDAKARNIGEYNELSPNKIPHIVIAIDEAAELMEDKGFEKMMFEIINDGYRYGIHTIMATSSSLKERLSLFFIRAFNYVITYDLADKEQALYVKINEADLLTVFGEALIKCLGHDIIDLQTPYVSEKDINNVINFINNQNK
jgi:S-DNA-T family DNA segregation ATPase FtsK/SpoIIIE